MLKRAPIRSLFASLLLAAAVPAALAQWVWRDENRQLHASDRPPPQSVPDKDILQRPHGVSARPASTASPSAPATDAAASAAPAASAAIADAKPRSDPALEAKRRAAEQEKRASEAEGQQKNDAARKENCSRARSYMQSLDSGMRITRTNPQGEREVLDDAARAEEVQRTRDVISRDCR